MPIMLKAFGAAFGLTFIAELCDKTQIAILTLSARYIGRARRRCGRIASIMEQIPENRDVPREAAPGEEAVSGESYVNAVDLFYWMEDAHGAEIPLAALWIDIPTGCRFCC